MYMIPRTYLNQRNNDECAFFNHSCEPSCGFDPNDGNTIVAVRPIDIGEELTYDYHFLETEPSLIRDLECRCGTSSCVGRLRFDRYRESEFQNRYYQYMSPYLKTRINELKSKWYSTKCFTRSATPTKMKSLHALEQIKAGEVVARFSDSVAPENHFIRQAKKNKATCFVDDDRRVIALHDMSSEEEITLNYHG